MIIKIVASALAPGGPKGRLSILIFHRVLPQADPLFPGEQHAARFDATLQWLSRWFRIIPLDDAVARLASGRLPARAACITFDDGYADNATVALPLLKRHGMAATFFVATSFLDGGRMWNDGVIEAVRRCARPALDLTDAGYGAYALGSHAERRAAIEDLLARIKYLEPGARAQAVEQIGRAANVELPKDLMMRSEQVRALRRAGMQIGAHTCSHPILARLDDASAVREIKSSKAALEALLDEPVDLFAYPNGKPDQDYRAVHVGMVRAAGFAAAVSTAPGVSSRTTDPYQLPRFSPWDADRLRYGARMLVNLRSTEAQVAQA